MKKITALLLALMLSATSVTYAADLSDWAKADFEIISKSGILTREIMEQDLKKPITREEVAIMMVNLYTRNIGGAVTMKANPFTDTDNDYIVKAYSAGIVSGKGEGMFDPAGAVTRQEFAKMLFNTLNAAGLTTNAGEADINAAFAPFTDSGDVADWAKEAFYLALKQEIINGTSDTQLSPKGGALREQAICIVSRAYQKYATKKNEYPAPVFLTNNLTEYGDIAVSWDGVSGARKYFVIVKDETGEVWESFQTRTTEATFFGEDYSSGKYSITVGVELTSGIQTFSEPTDFNLTMPEPAPKPIIPEDTTPPEEHLPVTLPEQLTQSQKEARVFPDSVPFASKEEALEYMVEVTVPVWRIGSNGEKYSREVEIEVNAALAEDVVNIFTEIFNSPEQFPIKALGGFSWRNTSGGRLSQHSYGTCIDINPTENYYVEPDGTPIVGDYWLPYEDPYSMPEDGIVVQTFAKYGWEWGGNCWSDKYAKDYMHFTYLGK